jgi:hypothetical protein
MGAVGGLLTLVLQLLRQHSLASPEQTIGRISDAIDLIIGPSRYRYYVGNPIDIMSLLGTPSSRIPFSNQRRQAKFETPSGVSLCLNTETMAFSYRRGNVICNKTAKGKHDRALVEMQAHREQYVGRDHERLSRDFPRARRPMKHEKMQRERFVRDVNAIPDEDRLTFAWAQGVVAPDHRRCWA